MLVASEIVPFFFFSPNITIRKGIYHFRLADTSPIAHAVVANHCNFLASFPVLHIVGTATNFGCLGPP